MHRAGTLPKSNNWLEWRVHEWNRHGHTPTHRCILLLADTPIRSPNALLILWPLCGLLKAPACHE
jgi:hypothetical protein